MPLCGGVPEASITCAMIVVVPLNGNTVADDVSEMTEPDGASNGTRWQARLDEQEKRRQKDQRRKA